MAKGGLVGRDGKTVDPWEWRNTQELNIIQRAPIILLLCLATAHTPFPAHAAQFTRGTDPASDWQLRIDRELNKMREEAARLHTVGDKLWKPSDRGGKENYRPVEENTARTRAGDGQKQEDDGPTDYSNPGIPQAPVRHDYGKQAPAPPQPPQPPPPPPPPQDDAKNLQVLGLAAEQGDARAQCALGTMYANGEGVPKNDVKAVQLYEKAARQHNAAAQYALGWMYAHGRGVQRDEVKAVQLCLQAAAQGIVTRSACQKLRRTAK